MTAKATLGRYEIIREIARSNDIVYEAIDPSIGRRVALKELQLPPNLVGSAKRERIERFYREAKAAGALTHPNIVTVFEVNNEGNRHFIAMEFLEGQTLQDLIDIRGALPASEAVDILTKVLDALDFAHARGIVHRDIKPANIQVLPGGGVKLTDFGIARIMHEPSITQSGQIFGTPSYMSPEQIAGKDIDARSDLFSLGVVLYEAVAGTKPFTGDSVVTITYAIMNTVPTTPSGIAPGLVDIMMRALAKNPNDRYGSAKEFAEALRSNWQAALEPIASPQPGAPPPIFFPPGSTPPTFPFPTQRPGARTHIPKPRPPAPPLLTPQQRSFFMTVLIALVLAGAVVGALWGVGAAWESFQQQSTDAMAVEHINEGVRLYSGGDYHRALAQFKTALDMPLSSRAKARVAGLMADCYTGIGQQRLQASNYESASQAFDEALRYNPDSGNALYLKGVTEARLGNWLGALQNWEQAVSRDPTSDGAKYAKDSLSNYYFQQAENSYATGDMQTALDNYQLVIETDPGSRLAAASQARIDRMLLEQGR